MISNFLRKIKRKIFSRPSFSYVGKYDTWEAALEDCEGYDSDGIFEKVSHAALAVKNGEAAYERDSVLFYKKEYNYPLVAWLNKCASDNAGYLNIIDWGGALGSTYFQNRDILPLNLKWSVIEQEHFVKFGIENLQTDSLKFSYKLEDNKECDCILLSSVLQYLPFFGELLQQIIDIKPRYIILERTPFGERFRICKEIVKEPIYEASYACCVFCESEMVSIFTNGNYELIDQWESLVDGKIKVENDKVIYKSLVFRYKY